MRRAGEWRSGLRRELRRGHRWRRYGGGMQMARVRGWQVHWVERGAGEPLVLLHGLCGSARWWNANAPSLAANFRVLALDLVGFGRSRVGAPFPTIQLLADVVAEWLLQVGAAPAHVVGHSMGGHLAIHLAARHPSRLRRLVLVDAAGLHRPLAPIALARWIYEVAPPNRWGTPGFLPVIWQDAWQAGPLTAARALRSILRDDVTAVLPAIKAPTLVLWGERDAIIPPVHGATMRQAIPGARLHVIPGAYHNPMIDRPAAFNRLVRDFLRGGE